MQVFPRNQDDAYPLFLLCKDLLRKFHLNQIRYAVREEEKYKAKVRCLHIARDKIPPTEW